MAPETRDIREPLSPEAVRRLATTGAALVGVRTALIQIVGLAGNVVFARLLLPREFGTVAFGLTLLMAATVLSDGGLGASLIRRRGAPTRHDLATLLGLQLALTSFLFAVVAGIGVRTGEVGRVTTVMTIALPFTALRAPALITLERDLRYRGVVFAELVDSMTFNVWGVVGVLLGFGVWGIATASVASEAMGTIAMILVAGNGVTRPRFDVEVFKSLIGFGARFQAVTLTLLVRFQVINVGVAAIGGLGALGVWSLAYRVMRVPFWVLRGLQRVSYPAMARLAEADVELRGTVIRMANVTAIASGILLVPLAAGSTILLPAVFGARWSGVADVVPVACLGLIISGPMSVAASGYLYASNDATTPLRATIANTIVWSVVGLGLLPNYGVRAVGIGWMAGSVVEAIVFGMALRKAIGLTLASAICPIAAIGVASAGIGYGITLTAHGSVVIGIVGSTVACVCFSGACAAIRRRDASAVFEVVSSGLGRARGRR